MEIASARYAHYKDDIVLVSRLGDFLWTVWCVTINEYQLNTIWFSLAPQGFFFFRMFEIEEHNSKYVSTAFHATHFASKDPVLGGVSVSDLPRNGKVSWLDPKRLIHNPRFVTFSGCFVQHC